MSEFERLEKLLNKHNRDIMPKKAPLLTDAGFRKDFSDALLEVQRSRRGDTKTEDFSNRIPNSKQIKMKLFKKKHSD